MDTLKKIEGAGRGQDVGVHVRNAISRSLESYGLGHLPQELPSTQEDPVRLYLLGSPVADVIKAVFDSERQGGRHTAFDQYLRGSGTVAPDPADRLRLTTAQDRTANPLQSRRTRWAGKLPQRSSDPRQRNGPRCRVPLGSGYSPERGT